MRIAYLCDHPQYARQLARWHHDEWSPLLPDWSFEEALAELQTHRARRAIPTTLMGLREPAQGSTDGEPQLIGSVSLLQNDHEQIRRYSPWLASLYVQPRFRGLGYGIELVQRCVDEARLLGLSQLYLYTAAQQAFYLRLGWHEVDRQALEKSEISVMALSL